MAAMLEVEALSKRFGGLHAVADLSFVAREGQITSLIGPNGAGKSTAFNLISGAITADQGVVRLDGANVTGWPPQRLQRMGLCRSFQITNLLFELTVHENVRLAAQAQLPRRRFFARLPSLHEAARDGDALLDGFGLASFSDQPAGTLSHGDQRRLEIAVCMAGKPRLLLLDEPTQGMSPAETQATEGLIRRLAQQHGVTILLVEHDIELVMTLSDHVVVMQQGAKIAEGPPEQVRADRRVQEAYLGVAAEASGEQVLSHA
ncbi:MAG: ABC transporter ATP-binding protein [Chitinophagaceae bacterium]|nr:ABC transporter ATP-binding protein [Rubrivivax sp.]